MLRLAEASVSMGKKGRERSTPLARIDRCFATHDIQIKIISGIIGTSGMISLNRLIKRNLFNFHCAIKCRSAFVLTPQYHCRVHLKHSPTGLYGESAGNAVCATGFYKSFSY
jgi:hypothetical protein